MDDFAHADSCLCREEPLRPERSVPVDGFSRALRQAEDVQRYWFFFALRGHVPLPVHLVFSPRAATAEIKAGDVKAYRVEHVSSPCEARERWIAWWKNTGQRRGVVGPPRRTGNAPRLAHATS
jgi:hypothetical protein